MKKQYNTCTALTAELVRLAMTVAEKHRGSNDFTTKVKGLGCTNFVFLKQDASFRGTFQKSHAERMEISSGKGRVVQK
jgi:hypothetical protein